MFVIRDVNPALYTPFDIAYAPATSTVIVLLDTATLSVSRVVITMFVAIPVAPLAGLVETTTGARVSTAVNVQFVDRTFPAASRAVMIVTTACKFVYGSVRSTRTEYPPFVFVISAVNPALYTPFDIAYAPATSTVIVLLDTATLSVSRVVITMFVAIPVAPLAGLVETTAGARVSTAVNVKFVLRTFPDASRAVIIVTTACKFVYGSVRSTRTV